jgi:coronin-7
LGNKEKSKDSVDDGLAALRRQPSIRDRKKLFEENIKKQQQLLCANINGTAETLIENKENQNLKEEAEIMEKNIKEQDETVQNSAENPIQQQSEPEPETEISKPFAALKKNIFLTLDKPGAAAEEPEKPAKKTTSKMFVRVAKFKHLKGEVILKGRIENVKNLSGTVPAECNFIKANFDRIAVPLTGPGGKLAVYETRKPGRLPDGVTPVLINGTTVLDFAFDPFDNSRLVAACDDGHIRVWHIPEGGLTHQVNEPNLIFAAHGDKIQIVKWHPLAQDVFVTTAFDRTVKIWDLTNTEAPKMDLEGHTDQVYSAEFSVCGRFLATVCRDGKIRIFEPRKSCSPISEGGEIVAKKGARVAWVLDGQFLIVTGFSKQSERQVMVYRTSDLQLVHNVVLDVSPAILVPFYDEDSNTLFLTSKGDTTVTTFEVSSESPYLFPLSPYRPASLHQGFAFLPKNVVDVKSVEFARAYRLTANTIEPIAFSVPRVKTAFFQDDLFPETKVLWEPTMSAQEWFAGSVKQARLVSLCPEGMPTLSSNKPPQQLPIQPQNILTAASTATLPTQIRREMAKEAEASLESSVSHLVETTGKLEQDNMETGVNEEEWNDDD